MSGGPENFFASSALRRPRASYTFLDSRVQRVYEVLEEAGRVSIDGLDAVSPRLSWALHEVSVIKRLFPPLEGMAAYERRLAHLVARANETLFECVDETIRAAEQGLDPAHCVYGLRDEAPAIARELLSVRDSFVEANQEPMLGALETA